MTGKAFGFVRNAFLKAALAGGPRWARSRPWAWMRTSFSCFCGMAIPRVRRRHRCGGRLFRRPKAKSAHKELAFHFSFPILARVQSQFCYRGKKVAASDIEFIQRLIAQNPGASRRQLSTQLCEAWNWVQANGQLRTMVCRGLMLGLHRAGLIELPARRLCPPNNLAQRRRPAPLLDLTGEPIATSLRELGPLQIAQVRRTPAGEALRQLDGRPPLFGLQPTCGRASQISDLCPGRPDRLYGLVVGTAPFGPAGPVHWLVEGAAPGEPSPDCLQHAFPDFAMGQGAAPGQS